MLRHLADGLGATIAWLHHKQIDSNDTTGPAFMWRLCLSEVGDHRHNFQGYASADKSEHMYYLICNEINYNELGTTGYQVSTTANVHPRRDALIFVI